MFIDVTALNKSYKTEQNSQNVLKDVSLQLAKGSIGVILGPSGSGKSTLMNIIGGVDRADNGKVLVDGQAIIGLSDNELTEYRREDIGFIFQYYNLVPNLTVRENIEVVSNISKSPIDIERVLTAVHMADLSKRFPRELSGGEQQRVAIARAIVKNPKLLLCDEPTGALDFETSKDVLKLLQNINKEFGTTILMITHNAAIAGMADRTFRVRSGEIVEVLDNPDPISAEGIDW